MHDALIMFNYEHEFVNANIKVDSFAAITITAVVCTKYGLLFCYNYGF